MQGERTRTFRTLFLSDFHLGSKPCTADVLLDFLKGHDAATIYLVGDIVDNRLDHGYRVPVVRVNDRPEVALRSFIQSDLEVRSWLCRRSRTINR